MISLFTAKPNRKGAQSSGRTTVWEKSGDRLLQEIKMADVISVET